MDSWIIFFGEDWGRHPSTGQHLAKELARHHKILWINSLGLRAPEFNVGDLKRIFSKLYQFAESLVQRGAQTSDALPDNVYVVSPLAIPLLKYQSIRKINRFLVQTYLAKKMSALNIQSPIVLTSAVESVDVIDDLAPALKVYYCADEYSEIAGLDSELVIALEGELLAKVDLVVTTSSNLQRAKSRLHRKVEYLPHGVDYAMFHQALSPQTIPEDIADTRKPLIGFVGLLGEHINYSLIQRLAEEIPGASIVLIGPLEEGVTMPEARSIHSIGPKPYRVLPAYLAHFDVCIIPYAYSDRNKFANPTKLREYLAAGCPVVSTLQSEVGKLEGYVDFAANEDEFIRAVRQVLENGSGKSREELSAAMREHSWAARADSLWSMIESVPKHC